MQQRTSPTPAAPGSLKEIKIMAYSDKYGEFFGCLNEDGNVAVFDVSGDAATRMDCNIYPSRL
jgi:hypothetical protein